MNTESSPAGPQAKSRNADCSGQDMEIPSCFAATLRLAARVFNGEVVFFVGSGLSLDSENNSATRLIGRLLAAILAMDRVLADELLKPASDGASAIEPEERPTVTGLRQVFGLEVTSTRRDASPEPAHFMT